MARIGLGIEDVGMLLEAAYLGQPVGAYAYHAPPLELDGGTRELGEDPQQLGQHEGLDVAGVTARVVAGPAKQQATVRRQPIVVERHVLIAHRHVLWQQALAQALRPRDWLPHALRRGPG